MGCGIMNARLSLLYDIIYSFWLFYDKKFLPFIIHEYVYKLIREGVIPDLWGGWGLTGTGHYSPPLAFDIIALKEYNLLKEVCTSDGRVCGLLTLSDHNIKPRRLYVVIIGDGAWERKTPT